MHACTYIIVGGQLQSISALVAITAGVQNHITTADKVVMNVEFNQCSIFMGQQQQCKSSFYFVKFIIVESDMTKHIHVATVNFIIFLRYDRTCALTRIRNPNTRTLCLYYHHNYIYVCLLASYLNRCHFTCTFIPRFPNPILAVVQKETR